MSDIVERLRRWTHAVDAQPACDLMDEAATEIERLRWRDATAKSIAARLRLTDGEREAVEWAALWLGNKAEEIGPRDDLFQRLAESEATLRKLLERMK